MKSIFTPIAFLNVCLLATMSGQGQLVGGDVNKPINQVYFIGNNNLGGFTPTFVVTPPSSCTSADGQLRVIWNAGTATSSVRQVAGHGGLRFDGVLVGSPTGGGNLINSNSFTRTFTGIRAGIYTFGLSRDPYDEILTTNNIGAGPADDWAMGGFNAIGDQQRCAIFGVILMPAAGNLPNITATSAGSASCTSPTGSVTVSGLTPGTTYEIATTVGGSYTSTGVIPASGNFVLSGLYPGIYPVRVRVAGSTCYRELNIQVPSLAGLPCFSTTELIDFSPTGTNLVVDGDFGNAAAAMPSLSGIPAVTDYTAVAIGNSQPQDSRYAFARSTDNADNPPLGNYTYRLRNLTYPTQNNHIFACLQNSKDHTGSTTDANGTTNGFMMVVNANYRNDRVVQFSGLNLIQGRTYQFSFWGKNLQPFMPKNKNNATTDGDPTYQPIVPRLGVVVNGIIYDYAEMGFTIEPASYGATTILNQMGWEQFKVRFTSPITGTGNVGIYNFQQGGFGNDFLIDDIELFEVTAIGDRVWNDLNKDGRQDANEPGMANVTVTLNDNLGNPIKTTVSDAAGNYRFTVPYTASSYSITFIPPPNYTFTQQVGTGSTDATDSDPDLVTGTTASFVLSPGASQLNIDCGLVFNSPQPITSIGDRVWLDANQNGIQDAGESGVSGVVVSLFNSSGQLVGSSITNALGFYRFERIAAGQYSVGVTLPPGSLFSTKNAGANDDIDSDINTSGIDYGRSDLITVALNQAISNLDIGIFMTPISQRSIGDKVWNDVNNNGLQDEGEPGIPSVQVLLYAAGADLRAGTADDVLVAGSITDGFGNYQFNDLAAQAYFVRVVVPAGYSIVATAVGTNGYIDNDVFAATQNSRVFDFSSGEVNISHIDIGLRLTTPPAAWGTIGDAVWDDLDADGIQDAGEPLMPAITVTLFNSSGSVVTTAATDSLGLYRFVYVPAGSYKLAFSNLPDGYLFTLSNRGGNDNIDSDADDLTGETALFTVSSGATNLSYDAGIRQGKNPGRGSLGNYVWLDIDGDGLQDANETGISGITVTLREAGPNTVFGDGDDQTYQVVTNSLGQFSFTNLEPSLSYRLEWSNINTSWYTLSPKDAGTNENLDSDGNSIVGNTSMTDVFGLSEGEQKLNFGLGLVPTTLADRMIGDRVWLDLNANGIQDASETQGIPGVTVELLDNFGNLVMSGGQVLQTTTNAAGFYRFHGLANGTYFPRFSNLPVGFSLSPLDQGANDLIDSDVNGVNGRVSAGLVVTDIARVNLSADLGLSPVANFVGDLVWNDLDGDGTQDAGEPGIPGVTVTLYSNTGAAIGSTVSDADGKYSFFNVPPGSYYLGFTTYPSVMEFTRQETVASPTGSDVNNATGLTSVFSVTTGQLRTDIDAGLRAALIGRVGDFVWDDRNFDGIQDPGEPGLPGVTIRLINDNTGEVIGEAITRGNGFFQFFAVPIEIPVRALFYNVPASFNFTLPNQGTGNNDSKVNAIGQTISTFTIPYGGGVYNMDAGLITPIILPATGLQLSGAREKGENRLQWKTLTEADTRRFEIERSTDGRRFIQIGKLAAAGLSQKPREYRFTDRPSGFSDKWYYRVKLIDHNGKSQFSNTVLLGAQATGEALVYPNPVRGHYQLVLPEGNHFQVEIINQAGQRVESFILRDMPTGSIVQMKQGTKAPGLYRIYITPIDHPEKRTVLPLMFQ